MAEQLTLVAEFKVVGPLLDIGFDPAGRVLLWHNELVEMHPVRAAAFDLFDDREVERFGLIRVGAALFYRGLRISIMPLRPWE